MKHFNDIHYKKINNCVYDGYVQRDDKIYTRLCGCCELWCGVGGGGGLLKEVDELTGSVRLNTELSPTRRPEAMVLAEV